MTWPRNKSSAFSYSTIANMNGWSATKLIGGGGGDQRPVGLKKEYVAATAVVPSSSTSTAHVCLMADT
jgi:hypothetical protein